MGVKKLPLLAEPPQIAWLAEGLIPAGYVSVLFSRPGEGKTRLVAYLATQVTRPNGEFAGRPVRRGRTLILDADDPAALGYQLWVHRFLATFQDADRGLIDLRGVEGGLTPEDVQGLEEELKSDPPALIVLDAFSSAFLGLDVIKPHVVHKPIRALTALAQATGAALLLVDHTGKPAPGQTYVEKGPLGSMAKLIAPRAAFALERVPPAEVGGRDVTKLTCVKQSYGPLPAPIGLELVQEGGGAYFREYSLPGSESLEERAASVILRALAEVPEGLERRELLKRVVAEANVSERTFRRALVVLKAREAVEEVQLPGRGAPKLVRLSSESPLATNNENPVHDGKRFVASPVATNGPVGHKNEEEEEGDGPWLWL